MSHPYKTTTQELIVNLQSELKEKDRQINSLTMALGQERARVQQLENELTWFSGELNKLNEQV